LSGVLSYPYKVVHALNQWSKGSDVMVRFKKARPRRISDWEKIDVLKETQTLPVSARGAGLCLYLSKDLCEVYGLIAGDMLKVEMLDHFRKIRDEE
jgi:hypothetical protein